MAVTTAAKSLLVFHKRQGLGPKGPQLSLAERGPCEAVAPGSNPGGSTNTKSL